MPRELKERIQTAIAACKERGEHEHALHLAFYLLSVDPQNIEARLLIADGLISLEAFSQAETLLGSILQNSPDHKAAQEMLRSITWWKSPPAHRQDSVLAAALNQYDAEAQRRSEQTVDALVARIPEGGAVLDIGAKTGAFSAALRQKRKTRLLLFEPDATFAGYASERFQGAPFVTVENIALGAGDTDSQYWIEELAPGERMLQRQQRSLQTVAFRHYEEGSFTGTLDLIRIDSPGNELAILSGLRHLIHSLSGEDTPTVLISGLDRISIAENLRTTVSEWFARIGYKLADFDSGYQDLLFEPETKHRWGFVGNHQRLVRKSPHITIGIPTRNRLEPLFNLLRSIQTQTYRDFTLIISDDGDKYDLEKEIRKAVPGLEFQRVPGPRISLPANRRNILRHAETEFVMMCDDDHVLNPTCVEELVDLITDGDNVGMVSAIWPEVHFAPRTINFDRYRHLPYYKLNLDDVSLEGDLWWKHGVDTFQTLHSPARVLSSEFAGGGCVIYRRSAVLDVGNFPNDYSTVSFREDTDLSHRLFLHGYKVLVNPRAIAVHYRETTGGCRDQGQHSMNFGVDGRFFLSKLEAWRKERQQLLEIRRQAQQICLGLHYSPDQLHMYSFANAVVTNPEPPFAVEHIAALSPSSVSGAKLFLLSSEDFRRTGTQLPGDAVIYLSDSDRGRDLSSYRGHPKITATHWPEAEEQYPGEVYCCPIGVDLDFFSPATALPEPRSCCCLVDDTPECAAQLEHLRQACNDTNTLLLEVSLQDYWGDSAASPSELQALREEVRDKLLRKAALFVICGHHPAQVPAALQALACGLPLVTLDGSNFSHRVTHGWNGYVTGGTTDELVKILSSMKLETLAQLRDHARATAENTASSKTSNRRFYDILRQIVRRKRYGDLFDPEFARQAAEAFIRGSVQTFTGDLEHDLAQARFLPAADGQVGHLSQFIYADRLNDEEVQRKREIWTNFPDFVIHYGGISEALFMLASLPHPQGPVLSITKETEELRALFAEFPGLGPVYFVPPPESPLQHVLFADAIIQSKHCRSGALAELSPEQILQTEEASSLGGLGIDPSAAWLHQKSKLKLCPTQVVIELDSPSKHKNPGSTRALWRAFFQFLREHQLVPVIISDSDTIDTPPPGTFIDKRHVSLAEQLNVVKNSDLVVSAGGWAHTLAAFCKIPAIVLQPPAAPSLPRPLVLLQTSGSPLRTAQTVSDLRTALRGFVDQRLLPELFDLCENAFPTDQNKGADTPKAPSGIPSVWVTPRTAEIPVITVAIPVRHRGPHVIELLKDLERQTHPNLFVLLCDDTGDPDLTGYLASGASRLNLKCIKGPRQNLPAAKQALLNQSPAEFICFLSEFARPKTDAIATLLEVLLRDDKNAIVSGITRLSEQSVSASASKSIPVSSPALSLSNISANTDPLFASFTNPGDLTTIEGRELDAEYCPGDFMLLRRTAAEIAGGFADGYTLEAFREEIDFSHRVYLKHFHIIVSGAAAADWTGPRPEANIGTKYQTHDARLFLRRLNQWRAQELNSREMLARLGTIDVLVPFAPDDWQTLAFALGLAPAVDRHIRFTAASASQQIDPTPYDFAILNRPEYLRTVSNPALGKFIYGITTGEFEAGIRISLGIYKLAGAFALNRQLSPALQYLKNGYYCEPGVDLLAFMPATPSNRSTVCWCGSENSPDYPVILAACDSLELHLLPFSYPEMATDVSLPEQLRRLRKNVFDRASACICTAESPDRVVLEALACGLPVISTPKGLAPQTLVDGFNGFIVSPDLEGLREALAAVFQPAATAMRVAARKTAELSWGWKQRAVKFEAMLLEMITTPSFTPGVRAERPRLEPASPTGPLTLNDLITKEDGRFVYLNEHAFPSAFDEARMIEFAQVLSELPPFYLHVGGAGDAVLLLSTFYDRDPNSVILSVGNSTGAMRSFFEGFPELQKVFLINLPEDAARANRLRVLCTQLTNCRGKGATPVVPHDQEWTSDIDIFSKYGIAKAPLWPTRFRGKRRLTTPQVSLAPKGSLAHMVGMKRNIIDREEWDRLLDHLIHCGIHPVILGTPAESTAYPIPPECIDGRSESFREQMEIIASSDVFVGADSWGKTFAAQAGVPTIVFPPLFGDRHRLDTNDASIYVFLTPWEKISLVTNVTECIKTVDKLLGKA